MGFWGPAEGISAQCRDNARPMSIGMLSPQTGIHSPYATGEENSVQLGVELLNINQRGLCFSLVIADTESTETGAATAMQTLVDMGVVASLFTLNRRGSGCFTEEPIKFQSSHTATTLMKRWKKLVRGGCTPQDYGYWRVAPGQAPCQLSAQSRVMDIPTSPFCMMMV